MKHILNMVEFYKVLVVLTTFVLPLVLGQDQSTPKMCNETSSMSFDAQKFSGIWYEVGVNPAPATSILCTQVNFTMQPDNELSITATYSNTPSYPWVNQTIIGSVDIGDANNPYGYNFSFTLRDPLPVRTYKILDTDYTNYALICGYQDSSDNNTYFSIILTRDRMPNSTILNNYETMAAANFSGFSNSSLTTIIQEEGCYSFSDATRFLPSFENKFLVLFTILMNMYIAFML